MLTSQYPYDKGKFDLLTLHQRNPKRFPFLLESVTASTLSRFSLLFACPQEKLQVPFGDSTDFLQALDERWQQEAAQAGEAVINALPELPFRGGWFLFLSYELAGQVEPVLNLPPSTQQLPVAVAVRIPVAVLVDHVQQRIHLVAEPAYEQAYQAVKAELETCLQANSAALAPISEAPFALQEDEPDRFTSSVERILDYIQAGDVFQVNLSRAWQGQLDDSLSPIALYQRLRQANPAPFACLADFEEFAVISSSPERLVSVNQGEVNTRPIAGTRPRVSDPIEDQRWLQELVAHPKERAEHVMLIDLERNDLGRVCDYGSVRVNELMTIESYQHVHHIVSNVQGQLRADITPGEVLRAVFPGGTITGCPKVRCMEIIAELEQTGRGAYTGSVGYLNHNGDLDTNILIRTLCTANEQLVFRTGAGIVVDSVPANELKETRHKARGLLRALGDLVS